MHDDSQQRTTAPASRPDAPQRSGVRRRQHQRQRQLQQEQSDPYRGLDRELPEKQHQLRHASTEDAGVVLPAGDQ